MEFSEDARYQAIAEAYALDAVDFARNNMRLTLDWTGQSIQALESILDVFSRDLAKAKPPHEQVIGISRMWGSYLGEVYRKNHGATWGLIKHGDHSPERFFGRGDGLKSAFVTAQKTMCGTTILN